MEVVVLDPVHSLRKWFHTKALQGGMNILSLEMLMGHETGLPAHYIRPTEPAKTLYQL